VKAKKQEAQYENEIISVYGIDKMRLDKLVSSMIHTNNIVNAQVYISGFLDGGKTMHEIICHGASQTAS
jgi:poly(3-hydroxybutyrate) depolymerase